MPAYVADCRNCGHRVEVDWDGDRGLLPVPAACAHCGYMDGYKAHEVLLVGAFQVGCEHCEDSFLAEIPAWNVDYSQPTGLRGPLLLTCRACGHTGRYQPADVIWLGRGASMPQAQPAAPGQQRP